MWVKWLLRHNGEDESYCSCQSTACGEDDHYEGPVPAVGFVTILRVDSQLRVQRGGEKMYLTPGGGSEAWNKTRSGIPETRVAVTFTVILEPGLTVALKGLIESLKSKTMPCSVTVTFLVFSPWLSS